MTILGHCTQPIMHDYHLFHSAHNVHMLSVISCLPLSHAVYILLTWETEPNMRTMICKVHFHFRRCSITYIDILYSLLSSLLIPYLLVLFHLDTIQAYCFNTPPQLSSHVQKLRGELGNEVK